MEAYSGHPLDGPRRKLGKAEADLDDFEAEIARFLRRDSYEIAQQFDPETGRCTLTFVVKHPPPLEWSVTIGEIVHNLRSALDHLACALYVKSGGTDCQRVKGKSGAKSKTAFPIFSDSTDAGFQTWIDEHLPGIPPEAVTELRELQPYKRGDSARLDALAIVNRLSNQDKHRLLVPVFSAVVPGSTGMIGYREMRDVDASPQASFNLPEGPLRPNAPICELDFPITGEHPYVEVEPHFPIDIAFSDGGPVIDVLRIVGGYVATDVFKRFLRFFPQPLPTLDKPTALPPPRIISK